MKLWLDDERNPINHGKPDWVWVKTFNEAIKQLKTNLVTDISFDHDLGEGKSGYDVAKWIEKEFMLNEEYPLPNVEVHSSNPVGRQNILSLFTNLKK